jgi:hypothetical protein
MNGAPLSSSRKTCPGREYQRQHLASEQLVLLEALGALGHRANPDDILDVAAAAWAAI